MDLATREVERFTKKKETELKILEEIVGFHEDRQLNMEYMIKEFTQDYLKDHKINLEDFVKYLKQKTEEMLDLDYDETAYRLGDSLDACYPYVFDIVYRVFHEEINTFEL